MRILLCSHWFFPSFGGVETVSKLMADQFSEAGAAVTVVTSTPGEDMPAACAYNVVRQPTNTQLAALARKSDVIWQNMISLRTLLPLIVSRRPIVVTHQSWMRRHDGTRGVENWLKLLAVRACHNVAISRAIAESLPVSSTLIGNPFEAKLFDHLADKPRDRDIVFMGRLVSDKGCDLLLRAVGELKSRGVVASVSVIGDGPERPSLTALTSELGLSEQVEFFGAMREGRGETVARHRIMAIPSVWAEPFGIVALEGIAAGCAIVASSQGGLPDAAGPCGLYFPNGDVAALASTLERLLSDSGLRRELISKRPEHLNGFRPAVVAEKYLSLFRTLAGSPS